MIDLKPCPFCGEKLEYDGHDYLGGRYKHPANDCLLASVDDVCGYLIVEGDRYEKWNRRVADVRQCKTNRH